jgi:hypothetical protein
MASKEIMDPQYKFNEEQAVQRYKERMDKILRSQKKRKIHLSYAEAVKAPMMSSAMNPRKRKASDDESSVALGTSNK